MKENAPQHARATLEMLFNMMTDAETIGLTPDHWELTRQSVLEILGSACDISPVSPSVRTRLLAGDPNAAQNLTLLGLPVVERLEWIGESDEPQVALVMKAEAVR